ncbi:MAG: M23 family metallopeptidase, partial [Gammaproteobacteria bacterium]
MQLIVMRTRGRSLRLILRRRHTVVAAIVLVVLGVGTGLGGFFLGIHHSGAGLKLQAANLRNDIGRQSTSLADLRVQSQAGVNAVAARMAQLDARLNQLDAMGTQIVSLAGLKSNGFDFNAPPGEGGPQPAREVPWKLASLDTATDALEARIWHEESELSALEAVLVHRKYKAQTIPSGKPIGAGGWISSGYGWRTDPFTGERAFHEGLDFAGYEGAPVHAI